jgi:hypothetical protein
LIEGRENNSEEKKTIKLVFHVGRGKTGTAHAVVIESKSELQSYIGGKYLKHKYNKKNLLSQCFVVTSFESKVTLIK